MSVENCCNCQEALYAEELVILKCNHKVCLICLHKRIKDNMGSKIKCPSKNCAEYVSDFDIQKVLSDDEMLEYNYKMISQFDNVHQCLLSECLMPIMFFDSNLQYECTKCSLFNCVQCKVPHKWLSCSKFRSLDNKEAEKLCQEEMNRAKTELNKKLASSHRQRLVEVNNSILLPNSEVFQCAICNTIIGKQKGITLRQCFHNVCRDCIKQHVLSSPDIPIPCPITLCGLSLEDRESRELLNPTECSIFEKKSLNKAKSKLEKSDHCRKENCENFIDVGKNLKEWTCNICKSINCMKCDAIHTNQTCAEYLKSHVSNTDVDKIETLIKEKKLMRCPDCKTLLEKTRGCNWIKCTVCNIELCWILQIYRWGPKGRGDTSGGCKCDVNYVPCHPTCGGCTPHR